MWLTYFEQFLSNTYPKLLADRPWNYKNDLCVIGAYQLARVTGDDKWLAYIVNNAHYLLDEDGTIINCPLDEHNMDKVSFGKSLRILRKVTGDQRYDKAIRNCYRMLADYPRTQTGNFWHKDIYPHQVWLDGLYMGHPFYAACLQEYGEDKWDDIIDQFESAHRLLWNEQLGLYMHGNDCSRKQEWADPVTGQSPSVWLRAVGWFLMGLCDTYEIVKDHTPRADVLCALLQRAVMGLMPYQDKKTKMFLQVVDRADLPDNYPETSGSAMIAYALMKGARLGMISKSCWQKGSDMLDGIAETYLRLTPDGWHLYGICASAGLGRGPDPHNPADRNGTPEYYIGEKQMTDNQHGAGACMMAAAEQIGYRV